MHDNMNTTKYPLLLHGYMNKYCYYYYMQDSQAVNIFLDPGLAFGTGEHPTTKLCLLLLHRLIKGGEHFFDYGTGSGVLGIAAMKVLLLPYIYVD